MTFLKVEEVDGGQSTYIYIYIHTHIVYILHCSIFPKGFPGGTVGKNNPLAIAGDTRDTGSIPGLGRFPWSRK